MNVFVIYVYIIYSRCSCNHLTQILAQNSISHNRMQIIVFYLLTNSADIYYTFIVLTEQNRTNFISYVYIVHSFQH